MGNACSMLTDVLYIPEYIMNMPCKGICTYCGGKARLYNYIAYLVYLCKVDTFMDLFAGSAVVSLNINVRNKVINDVSFELAVIYKALSMEDTEGRIMARIKDTIYCKEAFDEASEYWKNAKKYKTLADFKGRDLCDAAYYAWILLNFSRIGSRIDSKFTESKEQMYDFMRFQNNLINYCGRLEGAVVRNESAVDILAKLVDNPDNIPDNTVIYLDPPYLPSKERKAKSDGAYSNAFGVEAHRRMLELVDRLPREKCRVIISGYDDEGGLYDTVLTEAKGEWSKIFLKELAVMFGDGGKLKDGKRPREKEYVFINFRL